jgi:hypothetical protein
MQSFALYLQRGGGLRLPLGGQAIPAFDSRGYRAYKHPQSIAPMEELA